MSPITLEEKIEQLDQQFGELIRKSPKTPAEMEEMERRRILLMNALLQQSKPLQDDVWAAGIRIKSVSDFINTADKYPEAIPVLIKHLSKPYYRSIKESIVRALAVKEAKGLANGAVMEEYRRLPKEDPDEPWIYHYRWAFGNTMNVIVTKDDLDDLIEIVLDQTNGDSRDSFVEALAKIKSPRVAEALEHLVNDQSSLVSEAAKKALKKKKHS